MSTPSLSRRVSRRVPVQDRSERRVASLLSHAEAVLAKVGYEATTMTEIAARAKASIGSVYQYFPNKEAITAALYARATGRGGQHLELGMADACVSFLWAESAGNEVLLDSDGSQASSFNAGFQPMRFLDGWGIAVPTTDADFAGMCKALGVEGFDDPRVATVSERRKNRDVLEPILDMCYAMAARPW